MLLILLATILLSTNTPTPIQIQPLPAQKTVTPPILSYDVKIAPFGYYVAVVYPAEGIWIVRREDRQKFNAWFRTGMLGQNPPFRLAPNPDPLFPYKLSELDKTDEILLQPMPPLENWYLVFGDWRLFTLTSIRGSFINLRSVSRTQQLPVKWSLDNVTSQHFIDMWAPGDVILVAEIMAYSNRGSNQSLGYLMYRFASHDEALQWLSYHTPPQFGLWVHHIP